MILICASLTYRSFVVWLNVVSNVLDSFVNYPNLYLPYKPTLRTFCSNRKISTNEMPPFYTIFDPCVTGYKSPLQTTEQRVGDHLVIKPVVKVIRSWS